MKFVLESVAMGVVIFKSEAFWSYLIHADNFKIHFQGFRETLDTIFARHTGNPWMKIMRSS